MKDLRNPAWMWIKAALFLLIGFASVSLLWSEVPTLRTAILLGLAVWAFCRAYYFAFYVLERYIDPGFRFAGLWSLMRFILGRRSGRPSSIGEVTKPTKPR